MKNWIGRLAVALVILIMATLLVGTINRDNEHTKDASRDVTSLWDWRFQNEGDASWRNVCIPHDWSIEGQYSLNNESDWQSGYLPAGVGYYQKTIDFTAEDIRSRKVIIEFEGVYQNSTLKVNGKQIGYRPNGYVSFWYDITEAVQPGENLLEVKVDHSKPLSGRWYTGSGIYRPVHLHILNQTHVDIWSPYIYTENLVDGNADVKAVYEITTGNAPASKLVGMIEIYDRSNWLVLSQTKKVDGNGGLSFDFNIPDAHLWSIDQPNLYKARLVLKKGRETVDVIENPFGVRTIRVSADSGLFINDQSILVKGVCMHHEAGPLGAAVPAPVLHRRLKLLKEMGCNAIRTSHNPFAPDFYNMCDTMGIMVMNEAFDGWEVEKARDDYGLHFEEWWQRDLTDFIKRDRNHPSVVFWSIGNEVQKPTSETQKKLIDLIKSLDNTRPVTQGGLDPTRGMKENGKNFQLDIKGFNGDGEEINAFEEYHKKNPTYPIIGTEVPHTYQTRGVYRTQTHWRRRDFPAPWEISSGTAGTMKGLEGKVYPIEDLAATEVFSEEKQTTYFYEGVEKPIDIKNNWQSYLYYQSSYDNATVRSSARKAWQRAVELPFVMGQFRWTGFDYLGETNKWPSRFANFGIIDICGFPKDHYYLYQSMWSDQPSLHLLPHWTHPGKEGVAIPVVVYTNCDSVQLILNDKNLGTKVYEGEQLVWQVPYELGTISAKAFKNGKQVLSKQVHTANQPHHIAYKMMNSRNMKGDDVYQVEFSIVDEFNVEVPMADNMISFELVDGNWMGADNGDPLDLTAPKAMVRKAFRGKLFCVFSTSSAQRPELVLKSAQLTTLKIEIE